MATKEGWIKVHRKALNDGWLTNPKLWAFWCYCLLKASYQDTNIFFNGIQIPLLKGQLIIGRKKTAQELKMGEQEIRTCITKLKNYGNITTKVTNRYTIITIVNWDTYQGQEDTSNQQPNQGLTKGQPTTNHIQEVKKKEDTFTPEFELFYSAYPKHQAKKNAWQVWKKLNPSSNTVKEIYVGLEKQKVHKASLRSANLFCPEWPMPVTWLNGRRWEDEVSEINTQEERGLAY